MTTNRLPLFRRLSRDQREALQGYLYITPWFIGFIIFTAGPLLASLLISFTKWAFIDEPTFVGLANYQRMLKDPIFSKALQVTVTFAALNVPLVIGTALFTALLLTRPIRGVRLFRTIY